VLLVLLAWALWGAELGVLAGGWTVGLVGDSVRGLHVSSRRGKGCAQKCSSNDLTFLLHRHSSEARE